MRPIFYAAVAVMLPLSIAAQDCAGGRYVQLDHFAQTSVSTIAFGSNVAVGGGAQTLRMDVYEPVGDALTNRPVIVVAFGGSFVGGTRADVAQLCIGFAKLGYVAIAPDYRVGFFLPNQATTTRAVMRGAHDMKACVRYLRKSVAENNNPYNIDPDRIIIGGVSAGAISALHATYLDQESEIPAVLAAEAASIGGVEGLSGSQGYSSEVLGCWSMSGAIGDTLYIIANDKPLVSVHEVGDGVVPYYTQEVAVLGIATGLIASGSHDIHVRMDNLDLPNCLRSYPGTGHVGYLNSDPVGAVGFVAQFFADLVCGNTPACGSIVSEISEQTSNDAFSAYPNPTNGVVQMEAPIGAYLTVQDVNGKVLFEQRSNTGIVTFDLSNYANGIYTIRMVGSGRTPARVVKFGS